MRRKMTFKPVMRFDPAWPKLRLFRLVWQTGDWSSEPGSPPYSHKLAVALRPRLFRWTRNFDGWRLVLLGIEVHRKYSWGGTLV